MLPLRNRSMTDAVRSFDQAAGPVSGPPRRDIGTMCWPGLQVAEAYLRLRVGAVCGLDDVVGDGAQLHVEVVGCGGQERGVAVDVVVRREEAFCFSGRVRGFQRLPQPADGREVMFM